MAIGHSRTHIGAVLSAQSSVASSSVEEQPFDSSAHLVASGFRMRRLQTPSGRMAVYEAGTGHPIVFLHGIGGGASAWTWIFVAPAFAATHRVILADWIGWGASERPQRFLLFDDYVASVEALLDDIGSPAIVVAQSLAGGFAMALAERRPDLFERLILHTPSGGKDFGKDAFGPLARATITPFTSAPAVGFPFYRLLFHRRAFIRGWLKQEGFSDASAVTKQIVDAFLYNARKPGSAWSALPFANGQLRYDIAPYLARLPVPASIFWGAEETQVGLAVGRRLAALRPDLPFTLIPATKACPELEQPQAVIAAIRSGTAA